ncbi:MAG: GntR family transcriptional regulator [Phycisphaerae bacterium]|nr:GntR family transcriptional regulator [Phycisphaerae bacterium]
MSDIAYRQLLQRLMEGRIAPGTRVSQQRLAEEMAVGLTPIREAIRRMCDEGLLYQKPQSGTFVVEPDRRTLREVYEVRCVLEVQAVLSAVGKISQADLALLDDCCRRTNRVARRLRESGLEKLNEELTREFLEADMLYHHTIQQAAGNVYAMKIISTGQIRNRAFGYHSHVRDLKHVAWVYRIHKQIVRALRNGDRQAAGETMQRHLHRSMTEALEMFDRKTAWQNPSFARDHTMVANINEILTKQYTPISSNR